MKLTKIPTYWFISSFGLRVLQENPATYKKENKIYTYPPTYLFYQVSSQTTSLVSKFSSKLKYRYITLNSNNLLLYPSFSKVSSCFQYPQDEGYVTPDSANILEDHNSRDTSGKKHWPQPKSITYSNLPSWNGLENLAAPKEKDFVLDFQQRSSTNNTGLHLIQVLQAGKETPRLSQTKLFTHLRDQEQFTMDLKYLLMGTPSHCFPYDKVRMKGLMLFSLFTSMTGQDPHLVNSRTRV